MNPDNNNILILGAGASMDYGFPSGHQLIEDILGLLGPINTSIEERAKENLKSIFHEIQNIKLGKSDQKIEEFINSI